MQAEFETAVSEGKPLQFALGCLVAACRDMPAHREGRLTLADHALALGLLVPMAAMQFLYACGALFHASSHNPYLGGAQSAAAPSLMLLWFALGVAHLRLAWVLVERDWPRVFNAGAMIAAATATLAIFMCVLFLDDERLVSHVAAMTAELAILSLAARWHKAGAFTPSEAEEEGQV